MDARRAARSYRTCQYTTLLTARRKPCDITFQEDLPLDMSRKLLLSIFGGVFLTCLPVCAHHGDAGRYEDNLTILKGTVVDVQLITPHSIIILDVTDENGKVVRWQAEMGARTAMIKDF